MIISKEFLLKEESTVYQITFHIIGFKETLPQTIVQKCYCDTVIIIPHFIPTQWGGGGGRKSINEENPLFLNALLYILTIS